MSNSTELNNEIGLLPNQERKSLRERLIHQAHNIIEEPNCGLSRDPEIKRPTIEQTIEAAKKLEAYITAPL